MKNLILGLLAALLALSVGAKIPVPPVTDESKAKAAEAAAKTAHGNAVANFQLCKSMDAVAVHHAKSAKAAGKEVKPATATPACADPGAFVYPPPAPGTAPVVAAAAAKPGAIAVKPAVPAAPAKKP